MWVNPQHRNPGALLLFSVPPWVCATVSFCECQREIVRRVQLEDLDSVSSGLSGVGFFHSANAAAICVFKLVLEYLSIMDQKVFPKCLIVMELFQFRGNDTVCTRGVDSCPCLSYMDWLQKYQSIYFHPSFIYYFIFLEKYDLFLRICCFLSRELFVELKCP